MYIVRIIPRHSSHMTLYLKASSHKSSNCRLYKATGLNVAVEWISLSYLARKVQLHNHLCTDADMTLHVLLSAVLLSARNDLP